MLSRVTTKSVGDVFLDTVYHSLVLSDHLMFLFFSTLNCWSCLHGVLD